MESGLLSPPGALAAPVGDLADDLVVDAVQAVLGRGVDEGQALLRRVGELLFDDEGGGDLVALIGVPVGDEAVQLGAQGDGLQRRRHQKLEQAVVIVRVFPVLFRQEGVDVAQVDALGDERLVVRAVGVNDGRDEMQPVQVPQQFPVLAVAQFFSHELVSPLSGPS